MWEGALTSGKACLTGHRTQPTQSTASGYHPRPMGHSESFAHVQDAAPGTGTGTEDSFGSR